MEQIDAASSETAAEKSDSDADAANNNKSSTAAESGEGTEIRFEAESFSVYGVVYTVDFEYTDGGENDSIISHFSIEGGTSITLSELIKVLGILDETKYKSVNELIADVENVEFSDPKLVWVGKAETDTTVGSIKSRYDINSIYSLILSEEELAEMNASKVSSGDWILISLLPFSTTETLTVRMKNGVIISIKVTDASSVGGDNNSFNMVPYAVSSSNVEELDHHKTLTPNKAENGEWDGTYTLSLDIVGKKTSEETSSINKADIVLVLDMSSSMTDNKVGDKTRFEIEQEAVKNFGYDLLAINDSNPDTVRMTVITFGNHAKTTSVNQTTDKEIYKSAINNLPPPPTGLNGGILKDGQGTNWEDALQKANSAATRSDAEKYVIFVSDGRPTLRNTPDNPSGMDNFIYKKTGAYGPGADTLADGFSWFTYQLDVNREVRKCYDNAQDDARTIVEAGKKLYTISVFEDLAMPDGSQYIYDSTRDGWIDDPNKGFNCMEQLLAYAYNDGGAYPAECNNYADDADSLSSIFSSIMETASSAIQYQNVKITDTLTVATKTSLEVNGHTEDFKYYKDGVKWDEAPAAHYENGQVVWDLGEDPLDNATYTVSFTVWPNQDAYDAIMRLNNGDATEEEIARDYPEVYANLKKENGKYVIYSNSDAKVSFQKATSENGGEFELGEVQTLDYPRPTMETLEYKMKVAKVWKDSLYADNRPDSISFNIFEDGKLYKQVTLTSENAISENRWEIEIPISPGIISNKIISGDYKLNNGHIYTVEEVDNSDYHYDFDPEELTPMLDDGTMHFIGDTDADNALSGTNHMRGSMTITKKVIDSEGNDISSNESVASQDFKFKVYLRDSDGREITGKTENDKDAIWYRLLNENGQEIGTATVINSGDTFTLKSGHSLRLLNLPRSMSYKVEEIDIPTDYEFYSEEYDYVDEENDTEVELTPDEEGFCIAQPNTWQYVTVTNRKIENGSLKITKTVKVNGNDPAGDTLNLADGTYTFELWNENASEQITIKADGTTVGDLKITVTNGVASPFELTVDGLTPGTYVVKESGNGNNGGVVLDTTAGGYNAELDGIAVTVSAGDKDGIQTAAFTNNYETMSATVKKVWIDNDNSKNKRPTSINVALYADGEATDKSVTLNQSNWTTGATIDSLPKYRNGTAIDYNWVEQSLSDGYFLSDIEKSETAEGIVTTLTNTISEYSIKTDYTGTKTWDDQNNAYDTRPAELKVILQRKLETDSSWTDMTGLTPTWTKNEETGLWTYTFKDLPILDDNGKFYEYQAYEVCPNGYNQGSTDNTVTTHQMFTGFDIDRTTTCSTTTFQLDSLLDLAYIITKPTEGEKYTIWLHRQPLPGEIEAIIQKAKSTYINNLDSKGYNIEIGLPKTYTTNKGSVTISQDEQNENTINIEFTSTNVWSWYVFGHLTGTNYSSGHTDFTNTLDTTEVTGSKTWVINGTVVPANPILTLKRTVTVTTGEGEDAVTTTSAPEIVKEGETQVNLQPTWSGEGMTKTFTYSGLPAKDKDGNVYTYCVSEYQFTIDGVTYTVTKNQSGAYMVTPDPDHAATALHFEVTQSGNDISNTQTTPFEFSKIWKNISGETKAWPAGKTITVVLNASTSTEAKALEDITLTFSPDNLPEGWTVETSSDQKTTTFKTNGLAAARNGAALTYYVVETQVAGYKAPSYTDAEGHGLINVDKAKNGQQIINTPEDGVELPSTGGPGTRLFSILGSILILGAGMLLLKRGQVSF